MYTKIELKMKSLGSQNKNPLRRQSKIEYKCLCDKKIHE